MRFFIPALLLFSSAISQAQEVTLGKIRGIVVGVSQYKNLTPDYQLNFADADAEAFYDFVRAMPNADPDNIFLLTNKNASLTSFKAKFGEAYKNSQSGDMLMVYFAGHGNLQRGNQEGFLLFHGINQNDTEYFIDEEALPLSYLHSCERQCMSKAINFVVITDACHSGKLMSETGAKNTMALLNAQWEYSLKLTSSQVTQVSYEDSVLRHGYFTYYLIESIRTATDEMGLYEGIVEPIEFETSLKSSVTKRANEIKGRQTPAIVGNPNFALFKKSEELVTARLDEKAGGGKLSRDVSSNTQPGIVQSFYESLEAKRLVSSDKELDNKISAGKSATLHVSANPMQALSVTPDGMTLAASASKENRIHLYTKETETWKTGRDIQAGSTVQNLIFSPDSKFLVASLANGALEVWDWKTSARVKSQTTAGTSAMEFSSNGEWLIAADYAGTIKIFKFPSFELAHEIKSAHASVVNRLVWMTNQNFVSASADKSVKVWKVGEGKPVFEFKEHKASVSGLAVDPVGPVIFSGDESGVILKWQPASQIKSESVKINNKIFDFSLSLDGRFLLVAGWNSAVNAISTNPLKEITAMSVSNRGLPKIVQSPAGDWMTTADYGGNLILTSLSRPKIFANHLYERIASNAQFKSIINSLEGDYTAALLHESHGVVQAFISGKDIQPSIADVQQAIKQLEYLIQITPDDQATHDFVTPRLQYLKGVQFMQSSNPADIDKAIAVFSELLRKSPDATYPLVAIAQAHRKKNEMEAANAKLQQAATALPKWTEPKSNLGQIQLAEGNFEEARQYFNQIIELEPNQAKGYRWMGELELKLGNLAKADQHFMKAATLDPANPFLLTQLANISKLRGKFIDADNFLKKASALDVNYTLPYAARAENALQLYAHTHRLQDLTDAYEQTQKALAANATDERLNLLAGKTIATAFASFDSVDLRRVLYSWKLNGDFVKASDYALNYFNQAISQSPSLTDAYLQKAVFLTRINQDPNIAVRTLEAQKQIAGYNYAYLINLGLFWLEQQKLDVAEKSLRSAISQKPNLPDAYLALISCLKKKGNASDITVFQNSIPVSLKNNAPLMVQLVAAMASQKNLIADAKKILSEIKVLDPENSLAITLEHSLAQIMRGQSQLKTEIQTGATEVKPLATSLFVTTIDGKKFLTDALGIVITELKYDEVVQVNSTVFLAKQGSNWGIWDQRSGKPVSFDFDKMEKDGAYFRIRAGVKWGLLNDAGKMVVPVNFQEVKVMNEFIHVRGDGGWGVFSSEGKTIVRPSYQSITEGRYKVRKVFIALKQKKKYYITLDGECLNCAGGK